MSSNGKTGKTGRNAKIRRSNWPLSQKQLLLLSLNCEIQTDVISSGGSLGGSAAVQVDDSSYEENADQMAVALRKVHR